MDLVTDTPLRAAWLTASFAPTDLRMVVVVKATFDLPREGVCALASEQAWPTGDDPWNNDMERSVRYASDFELLKPQAEAWITGTLRTREPVTELLCSARIGSVGLRFAVVGDRWWREDGGITAPEPFRTMDLSWERCFGGPAYALNPVGRGIAPDSSGRIALPNIEQPDRLLRSANERPGEPIGAWPIPRSWTERQRWLGTYDAAYVRERWPHFAADMSWRYGQAARSAQRIDGFFRGDEPIELRNLHPLHARLDCRLPGIRPRVFLHEQARPQGPLREVGVVLDTIAIDVGAGQAFAVWRGSVPCLSEALAEWPHLYVTHDAVDRPRSDRECMGAFVARLRATADEDGAHEAEVPARHDVRTASEPPLIDAPEPAVSVEAMLEQRAAEARALGWPDEIVEALYGGGPRRPAGGVVDRAAIEASMRTAERLGLTAAVDALARVLDLLGSAAPEESANEATPEEIATPASLREVVVERVARGESLAGLVLCDADLSQLDLSGVDLSGAMLLRARLRGARLDGARLDGASLDEADLEGSSWLGTSAVGASLSMVQASGVVFDGANLDGALSERGFFAGASFRSTRARGACFEESFAEGAIFDSADLEGAELTRSNFDEASFAGARLADARLEGASLRRACLDGADATKLRASEGADLSEARIRSAQLAGATFARSILIGTKFAQSDLTRASFADARLEGAELLAVHARGASFDRASMGASSLAGADLLGARFEGADLRLADLRGANLYGAEMWRANLTDARLDDANVEGTKLA